MSLMLEHAKTQINRQFIFFTPQDMRYRTASTNVVLLLRWSIWTFPPLCSAMGIKSQDQDERVKVLRLRPPERGQTTLALQE